LNTVYQYTSRKTVFGIMVPTVLAALVFIVMMSDLLTGQQSVITMPLAVLAAIIFLDHYLALSHPEKVTTGEGWIEFSCFGRTHHYDVSDIQRINIRKTAFSKSIYVRINDAGLIKGRYWLQIEQVPQGEQLLAFLETLVEQKHPMMKNFKQRSFIKTK
jgi:hypothetical protein